MTTTSKARRSRTALRRSLLLAAAACAALAAGCGGDDDKSGDAAKTTTVDAVAVYRTSAKAATAETTKIGDEIGTSIQAADTQTDAQLAATFTDLASRARAVVADLNALAPPADDKAKVNALVSALGTGAQDLDAIATAARANDASSARSATVTLVRDSPSIKAAKDALDAQLKADAPADEAADSQ
jgi:hypothetical protein